MGLRLARIVRLVEEAQNAKAPIQAFVTALREKQDAEERRTRRRAQPLQAGLEAEPSGQQGRQAAAGTASVSRPADAPPACRAVYNNAHARLQEASALVFDTETSGFGGCVLNLGWILADESGAELVTCDAAT